MTIADMKLLNGANYWSIKYPRLVVLLIEEKEFNDSSVVSAVSVEKSLGASLSGIPDAQRLIKAFLDPVPETISTITLVQKSVVLLQELSGIKTEFIHSEPAGKKDHQYIVFSYDEPKAGKYLAEAAVRLANALARKEVYPIANDIAAIKELLDEERLGPSTRSVVEEAVRRGIPVMRLDDASYFQLGYGARQCRIEATVAQTTSSLAVDIAGDKHRTKQLLTDACFPVPKGAVISNVEKLREVAGDLCFPLVVKPLDGNQGKGATINIHSVSEAEDAFHRAKKYSDRVVVEELITGDDFRALVINYKFVAAARRKPAAVTGDGIHTISELVEELNKDPRRGKAHSHVLTRIELDEPAFELLAKKNYTVDTVPAKGEEVYLKATANLSTGGTADDVTEEVHPSNITFFERVARTVGLDICGIDIMASTLAVPIRDTGAAIIEVNAAPGLRMHLEPSKGKQRNVAAPIIDMLFPDNRLGRIPIVAVTGTNGKTTTTRLIACMAQQSGYNTGFTTTEGIYLNKELIYKGDCSGPFSAKVVLKDRTVEFAVLETARGGILRSGLGYDQCDCAVITNVAEDHLGLGGIDTLEQLARIKAVVAKSVMRDGYVVLNADDDRVYQMKNDIKGKIALFSLYPDSVRIQRHCEEGGVAAVCEEGYIIIRQGNEILPIEQIENVPLTYGGKAEFNVYNVLGATLAAYLSNISLPAIRCTLRRFSNTQEMTPGRMNQFTFPHFTLMVDYAHNPHGIKALGTFLKNISAIKKVGVIAGVGDRRDEDIVAIGVESAKIFDEIIIRPDEDLRGRTEAEISTLLRKGILSVNPGKNIFYFNDEIEAVEFAVQSAVPDSLVVVLVDKIDKVCKRVQELQAAPSSPVGEAHPRPFPKGREKASAQHLKTDPYFAL